MPARYKLGPPHEQMLRWLREARVAGKSFDEAWAEALRAPSRRDVGIRIPHNTVERRLWLETFESTRAEWAAAFENRETRLSCALRDLVEVMCEDLSSDAPHALLLSQDGGDETARMALVPVALGIDGLTRPAAVVEPAAELAA